MHQTISVNHPLHYQNIDFYQSDWDLLGIRVENIKEKKIYELPLFPTKFKSWVTWIPSNLSEIPSGMTFIFDQFQNFFFVYNQDGTFLTSKNIGEFFLPNLRILEILPSTGLLIKYDPSIPIIYLGFAILMITTLCSYLPYTQIWLFQQGKQIWLGSSTNRGKMQLELELENLLRESEKNINLFSKLNVPNRSKG
jgi:cytochrome c biogenesis protein